MSKYDGKRSTTLIGLCKNRALIFDPNDDVETLTAILELADEKDERERVDKENAFALEKLKVSQADKDREIRENEVALEKERIAQSEKNRALEEQKIAQADKARDHELKMAELKIANPNLVTPLSNKESDLAKTVAQETKVAGILTPFDEKEPDIYLDYFEKVVRTRDTPKESWSKILVKVLTGKGIEAYTSLSDADSHDYDKVKAAILDKYCVNAESYRKKFREAIKETAENFSEFTSRLERSCGKWITKIGATDNANLITQAFLMEKFLSVLPAALKVYLLDHQPANLAAAGKLADQYTTHRQMAYSEKKTPLSPQTERKKNAPKPNGGEKNEKNSQDGTPNREKKYFDRNKQRNGQKNESSNKNGRPTHCTICGSNEHVWFNCPEKKPLHLSTFSGSINSYGLEESEFPVCISGENVTALRDSGASVSLVDSSLVKPNEYVDKKIYIRHAFSDEILELPVAIVNVESALHTGPLLAAVYSNLPYPVILGNNRKESVISGDVNIVTRSQAKKEKEKEQVAPMPPKGNKVSVVVPPPSETSMTSENGQEPEGSNLVSGDNNLPGNDGFKNDVMMGKNIILPQVQAAPPCYDAENPDPTENSPVQPQAKESLSSTQQKVEDPISVVSRKDLSLLQRSDPSLSKYWDLAEKNESSGPVRYKVISDVLIREWSNNNADPNVKFNDDSQIIIPAGLRPKLLSLVHDDTAGHFKGKRCVQNLQRHFWWPKMRQDVRDFCASCPYCQKAATRAGLAKERLVRVPIVPDLWSKLVIDITGPLRKTRQNNKYILVVIDSCSRYPVAMAMPDQECETVCSNLIELFCRFGWPTEIQTDLGSNFRASLMQELWKRTGVKHIFSSVHHPLSQGAAEVTNRIIKNSLRTIIQENSKIEWDQMLSYVMFAMANSINRSLGLAPAEVLFGRKLKGPLSIIFDQWRDPSGEDMNSVELVLRHLNAANDALNSALESHEKEKEKTKIFYDKSAKPQNLEAGDKVLILRPSRKDKLSCYWSGPNAILRRLNEVNYMVDMGKGKHQVFHSNILRKYVERPPHLINLVASAECDKNVPLLAPVLNPDSLDSLMKQIEQLNIDPSKKEKFRAVIQKHSKVFSNIPGSTKVAELKIELTSDKPVRSRAFRANPRVSKLIKDELDILQSLDLIYRCDSSYGAPLFLVERDGKPPRPCVSYKDLNAITIPDNYRIPCMEQLIEKLSSAKFITLLDLSRGFFQMSVAPESQKYTAMTTEFGNFAWKRLPFGMRNSPNAFQRLMDVVLKGAEDYSSCYIDDIAVFDSGSIDDHIRHVDDVLTRLGNAGMTAKPGKTQLGKAECEYLGKLVGCGTIRPQMEKVRAIRNYPLPQSKKQIRQFLGATGFYHKMIKGYSALAKPLTDCLRKDEWSLLPPDAVRAVAQLKDALCSAPVLVTPDYNKDMYLETDGSKIAVSAILSQKDDSGALRPIGYGSKKLLERESKYSASELEMLAVVFGLQKFKVYLLCMKVFIITDHSAIRQIASSISHNAKLARWSLILDSFNYEIIHRKGKISKNVDALSRVVISD